MQYPKTSRRSFLVSTTAGASLLIAKPSLVWGTQANSKLEVGIVGLGGRGSLIGRIIQEKHPNYQITAVADYFPNIAEEVGTELKVSQKRRFSGLKGYHRLLESGVDAILLETPPCFFPEHAQASVDAGVAVYMAKPLACDAPGCLQVLKAGKKAGANKQVFFVDFQVPTDPFNQETVKRIHEGLIGDITLLSSVYTDEGFSDPPLTDTIESRLTNLIWVNDIALGGGFLVNAGIHAIDAALWLARSRPVSATGQAQIKRANPHGDARDVYSITYELENGLVLNHRGEHLKNLHRFSCHCAAYGTDGWGTIGYMGKSWIRGNRGGYPGGEVKDLYVTGISRNLKLFHQKVSNRDFTNETLVPSVNSTLATILGREAGIRRTRLTWDELIREGKTLDVNLKGLKE